YFICTVPASTQLAPLSLHDALPISWGSSRTTRVSGPRWWCPSLPASSLRMQRHEVPARFAPRGPAHADATRTSAVVSATRLTDRSEEHTSELQSRENLVCRLLLEKK